MLLGAVDLGSNSFRVEIGRLEGDSIHTQNYLKETVRLAGGFDDKGALTPEIQARALAALARFNERLAGLPSTQVRAVGTQAMRVATNAADFLKKAEETLTALIFSLDTRKHVLSSRDAHIRFRFQINGV